MSNRRHLVSRSRNNEAASPAARSHGELEASGSRAPASLPPYEAPSCPLSPAAKLKLEQLRANMEHEQSKYGKHRKSSALAIADAAADANERLALRKDRVKNAVEKRREQNIEEAEMREEDLEAEAYARELERQVAELSTAAERATMDLIDYGDELSMQKEFMKEVSENATTAGETQAPLDNPEILSPWEILQSAKEKYAKQYAQQSMRDRYADNNEYKNLKRVVHDAQYPRADNIPPLPHAKTWSFPDESSNRNGSSHRRRNNRADNTDNDDDEEIVISGVKDTLKCPITLVWIKEPYSNTVCNHSFEKAAILDLHRRTATAFTKTLPNGQKVPDGPPRSQCPVSGCEKWHTLNDFYDDPAIKRRVIQAQKREQRQADGDDEDEDDDMNIPRGTQARRPEEIDDEDDDGIEIDDAEERRKEIAKVKRERAQSRGLSTAPSQNLLDDSMDIG